MWIPRGSTRRIILQWIEESLHDLGSPKYWKFWGGIVVGSVRWCKITPIHHTTVVGQMLLGECRSKSHLNHLAGSNCLKSTGDYLRSSDLRKLFYNLFHTYFKKPTRKTARSLQVESLNPKPPNYKKAVFNGGSLCNGYMVTRGFTRQLPSVIALVVRANIRET